VVGKDFEQCFTVEIADGTTVAGKISLTKNTASVEMKEGTAPFKIQKNGIIQFETMSREFEIPVEHGDVIDVKTSVECEGVYSKTIVLYDAIVAYPNPSMDYFEIAIPNTIEEVKVEIYDYTSNLISTRVYPVHYGKVNLNLSHVPVGIYIVIIYLEEVVSVKLLKQ
jgi:hypothetical protein